MVFEKIKLILSNQFDVDINSITPSTDLLNDLGADSLDLVDMLMSLEDEFNIGEVPDEMVEKMHMIPAHSLAEAIEKAKGLAGEGAKIAAIPDGVSVMVTK